MNSVQIKYDRRLVGKSGLLLFTQRHNLDCFINVENCNEEIVLVTITPKREGDFPSCQELYNELLECEFIASRYEKTKELREAIIEQIRSINKADTPKG